MFKWRFKSHPVHFSRSISFVDRFSTILSSSLCLTKSTKRWEKDPSEALPLVRQLLETAVEVNEQDRPSDFYGALGIAASKQTPAIIDLLLDHGAEVNAGESDGITALMAAASHGQMDNCKTLLKRGADASMRASIGESALELAIRHQKLDVTKLLLDHGRTEIHSKNFKGDMMLDAAIVIDYVVGKGIDINARAVDDCVALHAAAIVGDIEPVRILLDAGADPNLVDRGHRKPLWSAVRHNRFAIARLLLPRTTDINDQAYSEPTCLSTAARWGNSECVQLLLEAGAEIWPREPGPSFVPPERRLMWYGHDALAWCFQQEDGESDDKTARLILAAGAERPAVEPEFREWLEVFDREQPEEIKKLIEWVQSRFRKNFRDEHAPLRVEMTEPCYKIREERRRKLFHTAPISLACSALAA